MYKNIMIPVDLSHAETLSKALSVSADLAKHYGATLTAVGVTSSTPTAVARNPSEFEEKLAEFAQAQGQKHGVEIAAKAMVSHDPTVDLNDALTKAASELYCDLVVMASHVPGFADYIFASRAGYLASHTELSVFVVR